MIKFDHFSRFQKDFRQKMQGLHKIDHNSRKNLKLKGEKLKTQAKNSRFRQNQKRGLPKIGRKKKAGLSKQTSVEIIFCAETWSIERNEKYLKNELTFPDSFVAFWIEVVWLFDVVYRLCLSVDVATVKTVLCSWNGKTPIKYRHFCGQQNRSNKKYSLKTVIDCLFKDVMTYFWPVGLEEGGGNPLPSLWVKKILLIVTA